MTACGNPVITQRNVDEPVGVSHEYGAPRNTSYSAEVETEKDVLRLAVFEQSECEKIRVRVVARTEETLHDDEVVDREPLGPIQIADGSDGVVPCAQRYARDVRVTLRVGSADHLLGRTDAFGEIAVNLSDELKQSLYGEGAPAEAELFVERTPVMKVPLAELNKHEARKLELLAEFETLLSQEGEPTSAQIARSYVLYEQLRQLGRIDARVNGLCARFLELLYGRKAMEATENLKRNLNALKEARELLGGGGVPVFVQVAARAGDTPAGVLNWARGQVALVVHSTPSVCQQGFSWSRVSGALPNAARFAFSYLRYAYDDPFERQVSALCTKLGHS